jgi:hypothetical protein
MKNPENNSFFSSNRYFWIFYMIAVAAGVFWRLYLISDQILLDDEWHLLNFVIHNSLWDILTHFARAGANIIPLNAYVHLLLITRGWSEILLILPSLIAGIAGLLIFPLALKRIFNQRVAVFFSFLLAVSPLLTFYSRVCRPYSIYTILGFLNIWVLYEWTKTGKKMLGLMFAVVSLLCIYFHPVGLFFVFVPLGCAFIAKLTKRSRRFLGIHESVLPTFKDLTIAGCVILASLALLLTFPIIQQLTNMNENVGPAKFSLKTVTGSLQIISGTTNLSLIILFYTMLTGGLVQLYRKSFILGITFISVFTTYIAASLITKFDYANVPLVLVRYIIPAVPMAYVLVAISLDSLWQIAWNVGVNKKILNIAYYSAVVCFLFGLFWTGPLRQIYTAPNNFTSHSVFQESYAPLKWDYPRASDMLETAYSLNTKNMSLFYKRLANQQAVQKIIEYPMLLGNHFNLLYYYQRFHRKNILAGYTLSIKDPPNEKAVGVSGDMIIDQVLSQVKDPGKLKFKNMVNILDMAAVKKSRADMLVLHKNPFAEIFGMNFDHNENELPIVSAISQVYYSLFGPPVFEDNHLIVYSIRSS